MSEFKREERFIVVKLKDLVSCSSMEEPREAEEALRDFLASWQIPTRACVVVESDWPEYELVWKMIQDRVEGKSATPSEDGRDWLAYEDCECREDETGVHSVSRLRAAQAFNDLCRMLGGRWPDAKLEQESPVTHRFFMELLADPVAATPSEDGREVPEVVANIEIDDPTPDEYGDWEVVPVNESCELLAAHNSGFIPLMTIAQHSRIVAAKEAEIARLQQFNISINQENARLFADYTAADDECVKLNAELRAKPARHVGGDEREAFEARAIHIPTDRKPLHPELYMPPTQWAWEAWQARAALAPASVVMPEPVYLRQPYQDRPWFWITPTSDDEKSFCTAFVHVDEVARLNRRAIPVDLLEKAAELLNGYQQVIEGCHSSEIERFDYLPEVQCTADELRALLGKDGFAEAVQDAQAQGAEDDALRGKP